MVSKHNWVIFFLKEYLYVHVFGGLRERTYTFLISVLTLYESFHTNLEEFGEIKTVSTHFAKIREKEATFQI